MNLIRLLNQVNLFLGLALFSVQGVALAAECSVQLTVAESKLEAQLDAAVREKFQKAAAASGGKCLSLDGSGKVSTDKECFLKWLAEKPGQLTYDGAFIKITIAADAQPATPPDNNCTTDGKIQFAILTPLAGLPLKIHRYQLANSVIEACEEFTLYLAKANEAPKEFEPVTGRIAPELVNAASPPVAVMLTATEAGLATATLTKVDACEPSPRSKSTTTPRTTYEEPPNWCPANENDEFEEHEVVCVSIHPGGRKIARVPARSVVSPNRGLLVRVTHEPGASVSVTWGGTRGLTQPSVSAPGREAQTEEELLEVERKVTLAQSMFTFSARQAGAADLTIEVKPPEGGAEATQSHTVQLEVDQLSWGAIRFGFASVFDGAATKSFELRKFAGANQSEIALTSDPFVNFEIVVGFTPYVLELLMAGGRSHTVNGFSCQNLRIAPYFGFGLVSQSATGVEALGSIHMGVEFEVTSSFSVAGTAVWRDVTRLSQGYDVGSPVEVGTTFTTEVTGFGFGLVLNVSPDFLQFGTPSSSTAQAPSTVASTEESKESN